MNKIQSYIREATQELVHKVSWPTWAELQGSAWVVMIAALIIAALVYAMDAATGFLVGFIYGNS